jgi:HK97 family phage major capsid protein
MSNLFSVSAERAEELRKLPIAEAKVLRAEYGVEMDRLSRHDVPTNAQMERADVLIEEDRILQRCIKLDQVRTAAKDPANRLAGTSYGDEQATPGTNTDGTRQRALDLVESIDRTANVGHDNLERATRLIERDEDPTSPIAQWTLVAGDPHYRTAFAKLARDPERGHLLWTEPERAAFGRADAYNRAMSLTSTAGGFLVPFTLDPQVIITGTGTSRIDYMREIGTVRHTVTNSWNGVSAAQVSAEWKTEGAQAADASPTLAQPSIPVYLGDAFIPFSYEVLGDAASLENELAPLLYDAKARLDAAAFTTGTGSGQPTGWVTSVSAVTASRVSSTTSGSFGILDVYATKKALPARHRANAGWIANEDVWDLTRQFSTGSGPQSAFWTDFSGATPSELLGRPVYESSEVSSSITAGQIVLSYADWRQYYVADRIGTTMEFIPNLFGANGRPTGQRGVMLWWRTGGAPVNTGAFRVLKL